MSISSPHVFATHFDSLFLNSSHSDFRPRRSHRPILYSPANQSPSDSEHSHLTLPTVRVFFVAVVIVLFLASVLRLGAGMISLSALASMDGDIIL